jgi:hypothetical protein
LKFLSFKLFQIILIKDATVRAVAEAWSEHPSVSDPCPTKEFADLFGRFLRKYNRKVNQWKGMKDKGSASIVCINSRKKNPCRCKSLTLHYGTLTGEDEFHLFTSSFKKCIRKT